MRRPLARHAAALVVALAAASCAQPAERVIAMEPVDSFTPSTEAVVRRSPWLALNFDELSAEQQSRVERRLRQTPGIRSREEARIRWDTLGLEERRRLAFPQRRAAQTRAMPRPPEPPPAPRRPPGGA